LERRARALGNGDAMGSMEHMPRLTYRMVQQKDQRHSVEMISPTGKRSLIPIEQIRLSGVAFF
jgi:hypothetical protein